MLKPRLQGLLLARRFWEKEKNVGNQQFLLFTQCFLTYQRQKSSSELHVVCRQQMLSVWSRPKFGRLVKS